jgi:SagB-type dehydrogenase family enzyme
VSVDGPERVDPLPAPRTESTVSVEKALASRHTVRDFRPEALTETEVGQLLWAAQGITHDQRKRTAPSASALYALETYVVTGEALSRYLPAEHALLRLHEADLRPRLRVATGEQPFVEDAPLVIVLSTIPGRLSAKHGLDRAQRYADFEAGHVAQNLLLQAVALGLAGVPIGSFDDVEVCRTLGSPDGEMPRYLLALGRPA